MNAAKTVRLGVLLIVLCVAGYLLYEKRSRGREAAPEEAYPGEVKEVEKALDLRAYTAEAVPEHIKALSDKDAAVRKRAAKALFQIGGYAKTATPALITAVKDTDGEVRAMAAQALGRAAEGNDDAVPPLVQALSDQRADVRKNAAVSLSEIWISDKGNEIVRSGRAAERDEKLREKRGAASPPEREEREAEVRETGAGPQPKLPARSEPAAKAAIPELIKALHDGDAPVRAAAAVALGEAGPLAQTAIADLSHVLQKDADNDARIRACVALGDIGPGAKATVPALTQSLLHDKAMGVRVNAAASLAKIAQEPEKAVPALVEAYLIDPEPEVQSWCVMSLGRFESAGLKLAKQTVDTLAKDPRHQGAEFQKRVAQFRVILGKVRS